MQSAHTCPADRPPAPPPRDSSRSQSLAIGHQSLNGTAASVAAADIEDIEVDDLMMLDADLMLDVDDDDDDDDDDDNDLLPAPPSKHFLDYDSHPPPGFEAHLPPVVAPVVVDDHTGPDEESADVANAGVGFYPGESRRVDKKYETDGEISDFELATYSQTMRARRAEKALSAEDAHQQLHHSHPAPLSPVPAVPVLHRKKHFLDENPIAPDDEAHCVSSIPLAATAAAAPPPPPQTASAAICHPAEREHRSLDRNYDRAKELNSSGCSWRQPLSQPQKPPTRPSFEQRQQSPHHTAGGSLLVSGAGQGRRRETSFALARFLEHDPTTAAHHHRTNGTWPLTVDRSTVDGHAPFAAIAGGGSERLPHPHPIGGDSSVTVDSAPPKVECVYSLLSMLGCNDPIAMSRKFLELSQTPESCASLRQARSIPLIVQIIHSDEADEPARRAASRALHNVVNCHPDDKAGRREAKVLRHIEHVMDYCEALKQMLCDGEAPADDRDRHPLQAMSSLMKISFDEEHRHAMCQLGALQAIASIVQYDHAMHGSGGDGDGAGDRRPDDRCVALRRYAAMALTNLTFGDGNNKAALCANRDFMRAFVGQLTSNADDLLPVTANVLRNLSWRADAAMKQVLSEIGTITALTRAVMHSRSESTIKALLSALWNLTAHCAANQAEYCAVDGALGFLVDMLTYEGPSRTLTICENAGGVLRNVSSQIAVSEPYRRVLRQRNCLAVLLAQLSSESLTIVSNACGALWNLSAHCPEDQRYLLDNRAVPQLSLLVHSKHKIISNGSSAALKNLLNFRPGTVAHGGLDAVAKAMRLRELPTLTARKQRAFAEELDQTLAETCENIEITTPPRERGGPKSLGFATGSTARRTKSDTAAAASGRSLVPRCESNGSLVSLTASSRPLRPMSRSSPSTPKRTMANGVRQTVALAEEPLREPARMIVTTTSRAHRHYADNDADQLTDFSVRYGGDGSEAVFAAPARHALDSPDKCVQYAEEGTPVAFQSYHNVADPLALDVDEVMTIVTETTAAVVDEVEEKTTPEETTLQTPLMFSRRSSMGSMSSVEEAMPDAATVATTSDFSRLASGVMSPSELSASPSRMMSQMCGGGGGGGDEVKITSDLFRKEAHWHTGPVAAADDETHPFNSIEPFSSIDSVDSMPDAGANSTACTAAIMEQCIQMGIHKKPSRLPAPMASPKRSQLPLPKPTVRLPQTVTETSIPLDNGALDRSMHSINDCSQILDTSNEYPAAIGDAGMSVSNATDATTDALSHMDQSNEFMLDVRELDESYGEQAAESFTAIIASSGSTISDKHKDPDLMQQSVDRLTHELVSTAEYLRNSAAAEPAPGEPRTSTTTTSTHSNNHTTVCERISSGSNTNTWNEDTCPNEVSFPSISWTAPAIGADDDDTLSRSLAPRTAAAAQSLPTMIAGCTGLASQPDSLDTDTATLMCDEDRSLTTNESDLVAQPSTNQTSSATDSGIRFHVGGATFRDHHRLPGGVATTLGYQLGAGRNYTFDTGSAAMTKSTIIALEANKLLQRMPTHGDDDAHLGDSCNSLDVLEDVRPPSGMDSCSAYFESQPTSMVMGPTSMSQLGGQPMGAQAQTGGIAPMFSPQLARRKKSLPAGLMAKRALHHFASGGGHGGAGGGSLESVHSSCILDNVKPPSIMDELMDSMISVASITSEVASPDNSQYDTAVSQMLRHDDDHDDDRTEAPDADDDDDDDTTTLRSCTDMSAGLDVAARLSDRALLAAADLSSADSTPVRKVRNVRRALTLKQKRQATKERYRTYTIAADMMLLDSADEAATQHDETSDDANVAEDNDNVQYMVEKLDADKQLVGDEFTGLADATQTVQIEIVEEKTPRLTPRQRRQDDRIRFQTQIIESFHLDALKQSPDHQQHIGDITTSSGSNSLDDDADMASIRALTERFRYISNPEPPVQSTFHYSPSNRHLETIVATEFDSLSADEHDLDPDPLTYIDEQTYDIYVPPSAAANAGPQLPSPSPSPLPSNICKPKIVKPTGSPPPVANLPDCEPKAIRGKKKAAYVSPYRKSTASMTATNAAIGTKTMAVHSTTASATAHTKPRAGSAICKLMATKCVGNRSTAAKIVAKTHVLHKSAGGLATKLVPISGGRTNNNSIVQPTGPTAPATPPAMPERQGTFVKDEPSDALLAAAVPLPVVPCPPSPVKATKLPTKVTSSPTKTAFVSKLRNPLQRSASSTVTSAVPRPQQPATKASAPSPDQTTNTTKRRSLAGGAGVFYRSPSTPSVPQRSNSNASLTAGGGSNANIASSHRLVTPPSRSNSNLSKPMASVSSRIASIWRKPTAPDSNKAQAPKTGRPATQQQQQPAIIANTVIAPKRLIRSSTFDNTPTAAEEGAAATMTAAEPRAANAVPLRRQPNGVPMPQTTVEGDKKRLSRLVKHHYNIMAPIPRLF